MDDEQIVQLYLSRSESAITETALKYDKYCYSIAYNIINNAEDAKEIVNDTYLGVWNSIPPHRPNILSTFLGKIARRLAIDKWRNMSAKKRGGGEVALALDELADSIPASNSVEREIEADELAKTINSFISDLPSFERNVFVCRYWYFDSISSISKQFGFSQSKVKSMLHRTRGKLLTHLNKEGVYYYK